MTHRETLPQRRRAETFEFEAGVPGYATARFVATVGFYNDGRVGEKVTAERFLKALRPLTLREATVEDVREVLDKITAGRSPATARQYGLRVKSLLTYAHELGYTRFKAGVPLKLKLDRGQGALAKRIISEVEVGWLIRAARSERDRVLLAVLYAGGLRISELVSLSWADVIQREALLQLSVTGKAARRARCSCRRRSAPRSSPFAATPAPTIRCSPRALAPASSSGPSVTC